MKNFDLGQTIQTLANLGVIAGIVFLGVEIAQNTRSLEAEAFRELSSQIIGINDSNIARPSLRASDMTRESFADLSAELQSQLGTETLSRFRYGDQVFYHCEVGMLKEDRFESLMRPLTDNICGWLYQEVWKNLETNFVDGYREYIDSAISKC